VPLSAAPTQPRADRASRPPPPPPGFAVFRHYLPLRKALLFASETLWLVASLMAVLSSHLWPQFLDMSTRRLLAQQGLSPRDALLRCAASATLLALLAQVTLAFNELYDFRVSGSRYERSSRFVGSAGSTLFLSLLALLAAHLWNLEAVLGFPGLPLMQQVVGLTAGLSLGFVVLYLMRPLYHLFLRRFAFNERVLVLGAGRWALELAEEIAARPSAGCEIVGLLPELGATAAQPSAAPSSAAPSSVATTSAAQPSVATTSAATTGAAMTSAADARAAPSAPRESARPKTAAAASAANEEIRPEGSRSAKGPTLRVLEPRLARDNGLLEYAREFGIDTIAVALDDRRAQIPMHELLRCRMSGIHVVEGEQMFERVTGKLAVSAMRPSYMVFNEGFRQHPLGELAKRALDVVLALVMLALLWPAMLLTALLVALGSPGGAIYAQERVGRWGQPFTLRKFRSMRQDAEASSGPVWASSGDPRITPVGRVIRKTRLDELPQLWNVLVGEMSIVGPRPERPKFVAELSEQIPYFGQRHIVKPGLSGWAQINYPYGNTVEDARQKLQYDLFYIKNQSVLFDLSILFNTIKTVVLRRGT
jgi:exopolysaccharide biosynthesis polyprenyl glycosylphosphotransferase